MSLLSSGWLPRRNVLCPCALSLALGVLLRCTEEVQVGENFVSVNTRAPVDASLPPNAESSLPTLVIGSTSDGGATHATSGECLQVACGSVQACGNCSDDDRDGLVDAADPDCLGPCDDNEAELFTGIVVRVGDECTMDCYFDGNNGAGDDRCTRDFTCDEKSIAPSFPPTGREACAYDPRPDCASAQSERCLQNCLTPNGCDCFGCCELPAGTRNFVWLGAENIDSGRCRLDLGQDPRACPPCTPDPSCLNECEDCELCVGRTTVAESCRSNTGGLDQVCPPGQAPCDPANGIGCGGLEFCITGCCIPLPE
jgi:hypothetical protein